VEWQRNDEKKHCFWFKNSTTVWLIKSIKYGWKQQMPWVVQILYTLNYEVCYTRKSKDQRAHPSPT
jgi:hypothetical protein